MSARLEKIRSNLEAALSPASCTLFDDSAAHRGHAGAANGAGHYRVHLVSEQFAGLNRVARHRLVYDAVGDMMGNEIHALLITALTPEEASSSG